MTRTFKGKKKKFSGNQNVFVFSSFFFFIHQVNRCCIFCDTRTRLHSSSCSDLPRDTFRYGSVGLWVGDKLPLNEWAARPKLHHAEVWRRQRGTAQLSARGVINAPSFEAIPHPPLYHQPPPPPRATHRAIYQLSFTCGVACRVTDCKAVLQTEEAARGVNPPCLLRLSH